MDLTPEYQRIAVVRGEASIIVQLNKILAEPPLDRYSFKVEQVVNFNPRSRNQVVKCKGSWKGHPIERRKGARWRWGQKVTNLVNERLEKEGMKLQVFLLGDVVFEVVMSIPEQEQSVHLNP